MNPNNPSDQLPILPMGDAGSAPIFHSVGMAVSSWEQLEDQVASLFAGLLGARSDAALRAYGMISGSGARRDLLTAAYEQLPRRNGGPWIKDFPKFLKEVGNFSIRRNEIVHGTVGQYNIQGVERGFYLTPPRYASRKHISFSEREEGRKQYSLDQQFLGSYAYTSAQIDHYTLYFQRLRDRASDYWSQLNDLWDGVSIVHTTRSRTVQPGPEDSSKDPS